jgi:hypothetical protein
MQFTDDRQVDEEGSWCIYDDKGVLTPPDELVGRRLGQDAADEYRRLAAALCDRWMCTTCLNVFKLTDELGQWGCQMNGGYVRQDHHMILRDDATLSPAPFVLEKWQYEVLREHGLLPKHISNDRISSNSGHTTQIVINRCETKAHVTESYQNGQARETIKTPYDTEKPHDAETR